MPTPSTRTPVRIARGSYSNLNGSISDLQDGEISYAEDQNKLYIKEGSSLVSLTLSAASPTFTGDVTFTGAANNVVFDASDNALEFADNAKAVFGAGSDLQLLHDGTNSFLTNATGYLKITGPTNTKVLTANFELLNAAENEYLIRAVENSYTALYYNGVKTFETTNEGATFDTNSSSCVVRLTSNTDAVAVLQAYNDDFNIKAPSSGGVNTVVNGNENAIKAIANGAVELYHNNVKTFETTAAGAEVYKNGEANLVVHGVTNALGAGLLLKNADTTDNNYSMVQGLDAQGNGTSDIKFTNVSHTNNEGKMELRTRPSGGSMTTALTLDSSQNATFAGTVSDSKGELRTIVQTIKSAQHTVVAADSGKHSINSSGGWIINTSTGFTAGQAITFINNSGSDQTVTNTGCTMYLAGDTTAKSSLTLKGRGVATFICTASNVYYGSGAGLE